LLEVVSEKTGYPAEMLELEMDMEADLGIDSIKRVEIFGALTAQYPEMSGINPNELTELRTLGEIVDYVSAKGGNAVANNAVATTTPEAITTINTPAPAPTVAAPNTGGDTSKLEAALLEVVSEKTGYPSEMLELGMDMEADLGIDSIKRVEIFGALTAQYPEMSGINPNELTELRTLGEIVDYVSAKGGNAVANNAAATPAVVAAPVAAPATGGVDNAELEKALLEVVSEKTGYPAEMLELGMDMEADLGIDSIKRVEIFGALTSQYPSMGDINPNELTELRTLGEIVDYVSSKKA
jgi:acyl carrier protein